MNPITTNPATGQTEWNHKEGDRYIVCGRYPRGGRFSKIYSDFRTAMGINLWNGSRWLLRDGKRYLIQRVIN